MFTHEVGKWFEVDSCCQQAMDKHISVSTNWRSEVGIEGGSQTVMEEFPYIIVSTTEIGGFVHAASGHDPYHFVEELIVFTCDLVETVS